MFNIRKKKNSGSLVSPATGETVKLEDTGDDVFAGKLVGDGVAVKPEDGVFVSPCNGTVQHVAESAHAYSISSDDGLDILVHIGIDTVELRGEGFDAKVKPGERVKAGQPICEADIELIARKGFSTVTPIIISNISDVAFFDRKKGRIRSGEALIDYVL